MNTRKRPHARGKRCHSTPTALLRRLSTPTPAAGHLRRAGHLPPPPRFPTRQPNAGSACSTQKTAVPSACRRAQPGAARPPLPPLTRLHPPSHPRPPAPPPLPTRGGGGGAGPHPRRHRSQPRTGPRRPSAQQPLSPAPAAARLRPRLHRRPRPQALRNSPPTATSGPGPPRYLSPAATPGRRGGRGRRATGGAARGGAAAQPRGSGKAQLSPCPSMQVPGLAAGRGRGMRRRAGNLLLAAFSSSFSFSFSGAVASGGRRATAGRARGGAAWRQSETSTKGRSR